MNLKNQELKDFGIIETEETKKLLIGGKILVLPVFKIPIELLKYNILNGRIYTEVQNLRNKHEVDFENLSQEEANNNIENLIWDTEPIKNKATLQSIESYGQLEAGVILTDTTVIDGNRRFTCLRRLNRGSEGSGEFAYFRAAILDPDQEKIGKKEIRKFELSVQFGQQEKVDYDPLNKALSIYNDIKENEIQIKEMSEILGEPVTSINNKIETINALHDYLQFLKSSDDYELAKKMKVYYALEPIAAYVKKKKNSISEDDLEKRKRIYFSYLTFVKFELPTQDLRNKLVNKVFSRPKYYEKFNEEFSENSADIIHKQISNFPNIETDEKIELINEFKKTEESSQISRILSDIVSQIDIEDNLVAPVETLNKVLNLLKTIDLRVYKEIDKSDILEEIYNLLDQVVEISEYLKDKNNND